jgi:hypothetical protein
MITVYSCHGADTSVTVSKEDFEDLKEQLRKLQTENTFLKNKLKNKSNESIFQGL